jgi:hypothetical protein
MNAAQWGDGFACGLCLAYRSAHRAQHSRPLLVPHLADTVLPMSPMPS